MSHLFISRNLFLFDFSKTEYERKLLRLLRQRISSYEFVKYAEESDDDIETDGKEDDTVNAYAMYMTEVMSAFVFATNPSVNLETVLPTIKNSAAKIIKTTKFLIEVI